MTATDLHRIERAVMRSARAIRRAFDTSLRPAELNTTEATLLYIVKREKSITQRKLADLLHIGKASTGAVVDRLAGQGLVRRVPDANDRRVWRIVLTPQAEPIVARCQEIDEHCREAIRAGLTHSERHLLADLLLRLEANALAVAAGEQLISGVVTDAV
jgi:MarR family transcriptional regulator for hemolysin